MKSRARTGLGGCIVGGRAAAGDVAALSAERREAGRRAPAARRPARRGRAAAAPAWSGSERDGRGGTADRDGRSAGRRGAAAGGGAIAGSQRLRAARRGGAAAGGRRPARAGAAAAAVRAARRRPRWHDRRRRRAARRRGGSDGHRAAATGVRRRGRGRRVRLGRHRHGVDEGGHDPDRHLDAGEGGGPDVPRVQLRGQQRHDLARDARARPARTATSSSACPARRRSRCASSAGMGGTDYKTQRLHGDDRRRAQRDAEADGVDVRRHAPPAPIATWSAPSRTRPNTCTNDSCYFHSTCAGSTSWTARAGSSGTTPTAPAPTCRRSRRSRATASTCSSRSGTQASGHAVGPQDDAGSRDVQHIGDGARSVRRRRHDQRRQLLYDTEERTRPNSELREMDKAGTVRTIWKLPHARGSTTATRTSSAGTRRRTPSCCHFRRRTRIVADRSQGRDAGRDVRVDDGRLHVLAVAVELRLAALREHLAAGDAAGVVAPAAIHEGQPGRAEPARVRGVHDRSYEQAADRGSGSSVTPPATGPNGRRRAARRCASRTATRWSTTAPAASSARSRREEDRLLREVRHPASNDYFNRLVGHNFIDRRPLRAERRRAEVTARAWGLIAVVAGAAACSSGGSSSGTGGGGGTGGAGGGSAGTTGTAGTSAGGSGAGTSGGGFVNPASCGERGMATATTTTYDGTSRVLHHRRQRPRRRGLHHPVRRQANGRRACELRGPDDQRRLQLGAPGDLQQPDGHHQYGRRLRRQRQRAAARRRRDREDQQHRRSGADSRGSPATVTR